MKYKVKEVNYFGLDHNEVDEMFDGDLTYVGHMCTNKGVTVAVYHAANPLPGHKEFMLLHMNNHGVVVAGMDKTTLKKYALHDAVLCKNCNTVLYSLGRHHYHTCGCENQTMVDGGKDYLRCGGVDMTKIVHGKYNILTKKFTVRRRKK